MWLGLFAWGLGSTLLNTGLLCLAANYVRRRWVQCSRTAAPPGGGPLAVACLWCSCACAAAGCAVQCLPQAAARRHAAGREACACAQQHGPASPDPCSSSVAAVAKPGEGEACPAWPLQRGVEPHFRLRLAQPAAPAAGNTACNALHSSPADEDGADRSVEGGSSRSGSTRGGSFATSNGKCWGP